MPRCPHRVARGGRDAPGTGPSPVRSGGEAAIVRFPALPPGIPAEGTRTKLRRRRRGPGRQHASTRPQTPCSCRRAPSPGELRSARPPRPSSRPRAQRRSPASRRRPPRGEQVPHGRARAARGQVRRARAGGPARRASTARASRCREPRGRAKDRAASRCLAVLASVGSDSREGLRPGARSVVDHEGIRSPTAPLRERRETHEAPRAPTLWLRATKSRPDTSVRLGLPGKRWGTRGSACETPVPFRYGAK